MLYPGAQAAAEPQLRFARPTGKISITDRNRDRAAVIAAAMQFSSRSVAQTTFPSGMNNQSP
jgi:hypothetical protein